tara:strand:+ start:53 stop:298 length:246 start_codon:yes stop_codon:yes gene_type:complete
MRITNCPHDNDHQEGVYELWIIGTEEEINKYAEYTKFYNDFIEEHYDEWSITIIGDYNYCKKEFRAEVTAELKAFRKTLKK